MENTRIIQQESPAEAELSWFRAVELFAGILTAGWPF
jgi:hypothetical protein